MQLFVFDLEGDRPWGVWVPDDGTFSIVYNLCMNFTSSVGGGNEMESNAQTVKLKQGVKPMLRVIYMNGTE